MNRKKSLRRSLINVYEKNKIPYSIKTVEELSSGQLRKEIKKYVEKFPQRGGGRL